MEVRKARWIAWDKYLRMYVEVDEGTHGAIELHWSRNMEKWVTIPS